MSSNSSGPGAIRVKPGTVTINADRTDAERLTLVIVNTGDRPVQIGSHLHLPDSNTALDFDRAAAHGFRLDIPSGTSVPVRAGRQPRGRRRGAEGPAPRPRPPAAGDDGRRSASEGDLDG